MRSGLRLIAWTEGLSHWRIDPLNAGPKANPGQVSVPSRPRNMRVWVKVGCSRESAARLSVEVKLEAERAVKVLEKQKTERPLRLRNDVRDTGN